MARPIAVSLHEMTFRGGSLKEGRLVLDAGSDVSQDEKTKVVTARMAGGTGVTIDCACFVEGPGWCAPVVGGGGGGPVEVRCMSGDCGEDVALCVMDISEPSGLFGMRVLMRAEAVTAKA